MDSVKQQLGKGTLFLSARNIISKIVGLANVFIILSFLGTREYGISELVLSFIPLLSIFLLPGMQSVVIADVAAALGSNNRALAKGLMISYFKLRLLLLVILMLPIFFGATLAERFYHENIAHYIWILALYFVMALIRDFFVLVFSVRLQYLLQSVLSVGGEIGKLILLLVGVVWFDLGILGVLLAHALGDVIILLTLATFASKEWTSIAKGVTGTIHPIWFFVQNHAKWGVFTNYFGNFAKTAQTWLIQFFLGVEAVALYSVATGLISHTVSLLGISDVVATLLPYYRDQKDIFYKIIAKSIKYQLFFYLGLACVAFFFFPPVFTWIFPAYASAVPLFKIMLVSLPILAFASVFNVVFIALQKQKNLFFATIIKNLAGIISLVILIPIFGLSGVGWSFVLTIVASAGERYRVLRRLIPDFRLGKSELWGIDEYDALLLRKIRSILPGHK